MEGESEGANFWTVQGATQAEVVSRVINYELKPDPTYFGGIKLCTTQFIKKCDLVV